MKTKKNYIGKKKEKKTRDKNIKEIDSLPI
jgi:hypothetical protein